MTRLGDLAHARAGDKGDDSILALAPFDGEDFERILRSLTPDAIARHFGVPETAVSIVPLPGLRAVSVVVRGRLRGGVTRSASIDPHGKTLSSHLLEFDIA